MVRSSASTSARGADAVVLLHGQPDSSASWGPVRARLVADLPGLPVLAPDRPGYGANPAPATDFPGNVEWLRRLLDERDIERAILVGYSWAGGVAALAAARHPSRVAGLVLVSSVGPECLLRRDQPMSWPLVGAAVAGTTQRLTGPLLARSAWRRLTAGLPSSERAHARMEVAASRHRPVWRSFLVEQRALVHQLALVEGALAEVPTRAVVLAGTGDRMIPARTPWLTAERLPDGRLWLTDGPHDLPVRAPQAVVDAVREVLA